MLNKSCGLPYERGFPLLVPDPIGPIHPAALAAADFNDCNDKRLKRLSTLFGVEHLSSIGEDQLKNFNYPMAGLVMSHGNRLVLALKVQVKALTPLVVYFICDTGAPGLSFSDGTMKKLAEMNGGVDVDDVVIQETHLWCCRSSTVNESMKDINLLGTKYFINSNLCILFSPHSFSYMQDPYRIFYVTPVTAFDDTRILAMYPKQTPNILKKLQFSVVRSKLTFDSSDPTQNRRNAAQRSEIVTVIPPSPSFVASSASIYTSTEERDPTDEIDDLVNQMNKLSLLVKTSSADNTSLPRHLLIADIDILRSQVASLISSLTSYF